MPDLITRVDAREQGLKRYYTGEPCKNGHLCQRFVSSGGCCDCVNWKTPHGRKRNYANMCFPERAFIFVNPATREEMAAALRYVAHMRWHETALQELRKDPELMAKFSAAITAEDLAKARSTITLHELAQMRDKEQW